jgi:kumamolisin
VRHRFRTFVTLAAVLSLSFLTVSSLSASPAGAVARPVEAARAVVRADAPAAIARSHRVGALAPDTRLSVALGLAPRDERALAAFLATVNDPDSADYHASLTPARFAERFGPTSATLRQVTGYLRAAGLSVAPVIGGHLVVSATGTAAQIERAFATSLSTYAGSSGDYYATTLAPSLPTDIASRVTGVVGLTDQPRLSHRPIATTRPADGGPAGGLSPSDILDAYDLASVRAAGHDGSGVTVALAEFDGFAQSDIDAYDAGYGITTAAPTVIPVDGGVTTPGDDQIEDDLDIEAVQAIAPGATIDVYEAPEATESGELDVDNAIVSADPQVVSLTWGEPESSANQVDHELFEEAEAQGESVYAATGDDGEGGVTYPASDPAVTATGGTTLTLSGGGWTETAWALGGYSSYFATPAYQAAVNSGPHREVPDVAGDADPASGWSVYSQGAWTVVGGTDAVPPNWAAFTAIYDQVAQADGEPGFGFANGTIYAVAEGPDYSSAFHDITSGPGAGPGFDAATGWGSYDGANFIADELG